ncbi:MAG TPA: hypothetical protein VGG10_11390 [Rhizomicrobium sp.]
MRKILLAAFVLASVSVTAFGNPLPTPAGKPCRTQTMGRALDFWVGDWNVVDAKDGSAAGTNRVEQVLDGCAVIENWHGVTAGDDGKSLFSYDARRQTWDQVWVTQDTSRAGGLKHKSLLDARDGVVRFQGIVATPKGPLIDRTSLAALRDGRVRQTIEWSKDNGKTWQTVFDAYYIRKGAKP